MNYKVILLETVIWSGLWMVVLAIAIRKFPFTLEHDYPEDVKRVADIKQPPKKEKRIGISFSIGSIVALFAMLILFAVLEYGGKVLIFRNIFFHLWLISMGWNIMDLVIVDWLLICKLSCKLFMLPGTETYSGNKNYMFHFKGFLKGILAMSIFALLAALVAYGTLAVLY